VLTNICLVYKTGQLNYNKSINNKDEGVVARRQANLKKILILAKEERGLMDFRGNETLERLGDEKESEPLFRTFVEVCLVHMIPRTEWNDGRTCRKISDMFSEADEALTMLLLENNSEDWEMLGEAEEGNAGTIDNKDRKRKYTHKKTNKKEGGGTKGWVLEGIARFNLLLKVIKKARKKDNKVQGENGNAIVRNHISLDWEKNLMKAFRHERDGNNDQDGDTTVTHADGEGENEGQGSTAESLPVLATAENLFDDDDPCDDPDVASNEFGHWIAI
jgi:hypothetical protein